MTDWDKELAKIDKQLASVSDEELLRASTIPPVKAGPPAQVKAGTVPASRDLTPAVRPTRGWTVYLRVLIALGLGVGILFWPHSTYPIRCGPNLFLYLGGTALITLAGMWSGVWTWRHRAGAAHVASLMVIAWGIGLAATQILPRAGYARPDLNHPTTWFCE
ncbi:MAG: hypothetical protein H0W30_03045 [Gemmatimonadaceae bacterium]|nr:hypothetical protein [Gemmatimonadaceae bacterium]